MTMKNKRTQNQKQEVPIHLGPFILSHSRRIMNNFILEIDGFKSNEIYYGDIDSIYVTKEL